MKTTGILTLAFLLGASSVFADLYQWEDRSGVVHITNDLEKVPENQRSKAKVYKSSPPSPETPMSAPLTQPLPAPGQELYGDQPLAWWSENFKAKKEAINMLESNIAAKQQYIQVFEGGRRFGQMFGANEVATYNTYRQEIPEDQKRLQDLKDDLDDLNRKAAIAGVPRSIRE